VLFDNAKKSPAKGAAGAAAAAPKKAA
jgi:hypothetical protein